MFPVIMNDKFVSIVIDNTPYTVMAYDTRFDQLINAIKAEDWDLVRQFADKKVAVKVQSKGVITVEDGTVKWYGKPLHTALTTRMIQMMEDGFNIKPLMAFLENLMMNPSSTAVNELYGFLEAGGHPVTPDGHFLAYKRVNAKYKDCHTGTIDNSIGQKPEMPRNMVDDNRSNTCSQGLHFCALSYLPAFHNTEDTHVMIVKINPADVVSIPSDYNNAKGRCWKYEVIGEYKGPIAKEAFTKAVDTGESFKPAPVVEPEASGAASSPRREQAIETIINTALSFNVVHDYTLAGVIELMEDPVFRTDAVEAVTDAMGISRKTASEYFRKLKTEAADRLAEHFKKND